MKHPWWLVVAGAVAGGCGVGTSGEDGAGRADTDDAVPGDAGPAGADVAEDALDGVVGDAGGGDGGSADVPDGAPEDAEDGGAADSGDADSGGAVDPCSFGVGRVCEPDCPLTCNVNSGSPERLLPYAGTLAFVAWEGCKDQMAHTLYVLDEGAPRAVASAATSMRELLVDGDTLYFTHDGALWRTVGGGPPQELFSATTPSIFEPAPLLLHDGVLYFGADGALWALTGDGPASVVGPVAPTELAVFGARIVLAVGGADGELWAYDGQQAQLVADLNPTGSSNPRDLVVYGDHLLFSAWDGSGADAWARELWSWDGKGAPQKVSAVTDPASPVAAAWIRPLTVFGGRLICEVEETAGEYAVRLWAYDGAGPPAPLPVGEPYDSHVWLDPFEDDYVVTDGRLHFLAVDQATGVWNATYLWTWDGEGAPERVATSGTVESVRVHGDGLLLHAADGSATWTWDGSAPPQVLLSAAALGLDHMGLPAFLGGDAWLAGQTGALGRELWTVPAGGPAALVQDLYPGIWCDCDCGD